MDICQIKVGERVMNIATHEYGTIAIRHPMGFSIKYDGAEVLNYYHDRERNLLKLVLSEPRAKDVRQMLDAGDDGVAPVVEKYKPAGFTVGVFPSEADKRNAYPVWDGLVAYFPSALAAVANVSKIGNDQHNPGEDMHWARNKSKDHKNKIMRHLMDDDVDPVDSDGTLHAAKAAWRALAYLQTLCEKRGAPIAPASKF